MLAEAGVGTTGYAYREWMGSVYPPGAAAWQLLPIYAQRLPTVEIASTFTRLPTPEQVTAWGQAAPTGFHGALKAPGRVSQELGAGKPAARSVATFVASRADPGDRPGPILRRGP